MKIKLFLFIIFLLFLICLPSSLTAKGNKLVRIEKIHKSKVSKWKTDISISGFGGSINNGSLWTATNGTPTSMTSLDLFNTFADIGITSIFYRNNLFKFNVSLGYMYNRIAINRGFRQGGFNSNWFFLDLGASAQLGYGLFLNVGLKGNEFISANNTPSGDFEYLGLKNDCYNKFSCNWYIGASYYFKFVNLEFKFGSYLVPTLNQNKIAYNNLGKTHIEGLFFEIGMGFKIFSTANKYYSFID